MKQKLTTAPVLIPFDKLKDILVTTDASDFAIGAVLEHVDAKGHSLGVVAYSSRKLQKSQLKWPTGKIEGYAIWVTLMQWSHYLKGRHFILNTDHESLEYLQLKKDSSLKVGRWLDVFAAFDFEIVYIKDECNKADGFSRRPDLMNVKEQGLRKQSTDKSNIQPSQLPGEVSEIPVINKFIIEDYSYDTYLFSLEIPSQIAVINQLSPEYVELLKNEYMKDPDFKIIYAGLSSKKNPIPHSLDTISQKYKVIDGLLYHGYNELPIDKLCIPDNEIRREILQLAHNSPAAGHGDVSRTLTNISPHYYWPKMNESIRKYVKTCDSCQRSKYRAGKQFGTYMPLSVPDERWRSINIDFLSGTEPDKKTKCDNILVVSCQLSKMSHFIPCRKTAKAEDIVSIFFREIFRLHGMPRVIISDRDKIFTSTVWNIFAQRAGIKLQMTISHNSQGDGQVERVNKILAEKITGALAPHSNKWVDILPMVEFAYNSTYQATIKTTPFLACYGYHPRFVGILNPLESSVRNPLDQPSLPKFASSEVERILKRAHRIKEVLTHNIAEEQKRLSLRANAKSLRPTFEVGQKVLINREVYQKPHACDKFQFKWYGPFQIIELRHPNAVRLALNQDTVRHDAFNVRYLKHYHERFNDYGHVPPMGREEIMKNIDQIAGFNDIHFVNNMVMADVGWKDCEP